MHILFIAVYNNPFTPNQGGAQRSNLLLNACSTFADVDVISFCTEGEIAQGNYKIVYQEKAQFQSSSVKKCSRWNKFIHLFSLRNIEAFYEVDRHKEEIIDQQISHKRYDFIVTRYVKDAMVCGLSKYSEKLIIDIDDNPISIMRNVARNVKTNRNKIYIQFSSILLKMALNKFIKHLPRTFHSNPNDCFGKQSIYLPNVPYYTNEPEQIIPNNHNHLLFVGDLDYESNQEGISHFLEYVFPIVKQKKPDVELRLVGKLKNEDLKREWQGYSGVIVTGFVPSIVKEYEDASIVVVPIYKGAGTCIKVIESIQMHRVCITTPIGFRGYSQVFSIGEDILVAESDKDFANKILWALNNPASCIDMAQKAYEKQQRHYTKEIFAEIVKNNILNIS